jgi:hypothetical protein
MPYEEEDDTCTLTIAVDPGVATGVAIWDHGLEELDDRTGQYTEHELYTLFENLDEEICEIRIESFAITAATIKKARQMEPIWFAGYLKSVGWRFEVPITWSKPADVMKKFPDEALKQAGWYNKSEHARDALRHLAACLIKEGVITPEAFLLT